MSKMAAYHKASDPSFFHCVINYKNLLQEYAQKSGMPLPVYQTSSRGPPHAAVFQSTVTVGGEQYTSNGPHAHRKGAEQDAARVAVEGIAEKMDQSGYLMLQAQAVSFKGLLNEYSMRANLGFPTYTTTAVQGLLSRFVSTVSFQGREFRGVPAQSREDAEEKAACAVIEAIQGNPSMRKLMSQIIDSKDRLYSILRKIKQVGSSSSLARDNDSVSEATKGQVAAEGLADNKPDAAPIYAAAATAASIAAGRVPAVRSKKQLEGVPPVPEQLAKLGAMKHELNVPKAWGSTSTRRLSGDNAGSLALPASRPPLPPPPSTTSSPSFAVAGSVLFGNASGSTPESSQKRRGSALLRTPKRGRGS